MLAIFQDGASNGEQEDRRGSDLPCGQRVRIRIEGRQMGRPDGFVDIEHIGNQHVLKTEQRRMCGTGEHRATGSLRDHGDDRTAGRECQKRELLEARPPQGLGYEGSR